MRSNCVFSEVHVLPEVHLGVTATVDLRSKQWACIECRRSQTEEAERPPFSVTRKRRSTAGETWHHEELSLRRGANGSRQMARTRGNGRRRLDPFSAAGATNGPWASIGY